MSRVALWSVNYAAEWQSRSRKVVSASNDTLALLSAVSADNLHAEENGWSSRFEAPICVVLNRILSYVARSFMVSELRG